MAKKTLAAQPPLTGTEPVSATASGLMTPALLAALTAIDDPAEIKALLDAITDTNLLTDAERTKLTALAGNWKLFYTDGAGAITALALAEAGQLLRSNGAAAAPSFVNAWRRVVATADQTKTADTDLAAVADNALTVALEASTPYMIRCHLYYKISASAMGFKYDMNFSGTTSGDIASRVQQCAAGATPGAATEVAGCTDAAIASTSIASTAAGIGCALVEQIITVANAGNWKPRWAQNTSNGGTLTRLKGSFIEYIKIA